MGFLTPERLWSYQEFYRKAFVAKRGADLVRIEDAKTDPKAVVFMAATEDEMELSEAFLRFVEVDDPADGSGVDFSSMRVEFHFSKQGVIELLIKLGFLKSC